MDREASRYLDDWLARANRQPLVVRGARQVGKTWLVRDLAARHRRRLVELNFERDPSAAKAFASSDPRVVLERLSLTLDVDVAPESSLLFLDEVQAAGAVLARLRWFAEELPALPVIAAGSLLEFVLADHDFSMPVGRIGYLHLEPMSFPEFLRAHGQSRLLAGLSSWEPGDELDGVVHERAAQWFARYLMVGGMPGVVGADAERGDAAECRRMQRDLIGTYRDDFAKYATRMDVTVLDGVLLSVVRSLGRKFVYARVGEGVKQHQAKRGLELLARARLCHLVPHSDATGLPLAAEARDRMRKAIALDVGIVHGLLNTPAGAAFPAASDLSDQMRSQLADQIAGQQLRTAISDPGQEPALHYWHREGGRPGEIDYVVQIGSRIVPVEIKSGAAGAMKSLHQFVHDRRLKVAVRLDANPPSVQRLSLKTTRGERVRYTLANLPHYLTWRIADAVAGAMSR